jgi:hypothetical protein
VIQLHGPRPGIGLWIVDRHPDLELAKVYSTKPFGDLGRVRSVRLPKRPKIRLAVGYLSHCADNGTVARNALTATIAAGLPPSHRGRCGEPRRSSHDESASGGGKACATSARDLPATSARELPAARRTWHRARSTSTKHPALSTQHSHGFTVTLMCAFVQQH